MNIANRLLRLSLLIAGPLSPVIGGCGGSSSSTPAIPPQALIQLDHSSIVVGSTAEIAWSSSNATSCAATGNWSGALASSGQIPESPPAAGTYHYVLTCSGPGGTSSASAELAVVELPQLQTIGSGTTDSTGMVNIMLDNPDGSGSVVLTVASASTVLSGALVSVYAAGIDQNSVVYAIAAGGSSGNGINTATKLATILGTRISFAISATIDPRTTIAAVWSMAQFMQPSGAISGNAVGLQNAATTAVSLIDPANGQPGAMLAAGNNQPDTINSLANLLDDCVTASAASATPCSSLFAAAQAPSDTAIGDTLSAALSIARNPANDVSQLYALASIDPRFTPSLTAAPNAWTIALNLTGGGLNSPTGIAFDAAGRAWVANYADSVSEFAADGSALSTASGITGGGLHESYGIAVDPNGNIWITNQESAATVNSGHGSLTELDSNGDILSGNGYSGGGLDFPYAIAIDTSGNIWAANYGSSSLSEFSNSGTPISPDSAFTGGGLSFPVALGIDGSNNIWVANNGASVISEFSPSGGDLSGGSGFGGGGINASQSIAIDPQGNIWSTNYYGASVSELNAAGAPLSGNSGYSGGGLSYPGGIAIDGMGRIWVADYRNDAISELEGAMDANPGTSISPASGFTAASLDGPFQLAIDSAGNLWATNYFGNSIAKVIGVAAPVVSPLCGLPKSAIATNESSLKHAATNP